MSMALRLHNPGTGELVNMYIILYCKQDIILAIVDTSFHSCELCFIFYSLCRFIKSSLISGEGLRTVGVPQETSDKEVTKIHQENVELLSSLPEEEILREKERIQEVLGW